MDRTGLEFNLSSVSMQNKNSSHCHLDIIQLQKTRLIYIRNAIVPALRKVVKAQRLPLP